MRIFTAVIERDPETSAPRIFSSGKHGQSLVLKPREVAGLLENLEFGEVRRRGSRKQ